MKIREIIIGALLFGGCAGQMPITGSLDQTHPVDATTYQRNMISKQKDVPEWVMKGSSAFEDGNFYGVGSASGIKNFSLQRTVADDRARNDIVKSLLYTSKSLLKDYQASTANGDFKEHDEQQAIQNAIKIMASSSLSGVTIRDHWEHPTRNELFSLAVLKFDILEENLNNVQGLDDKIKKDILIRAKEMHEELDKYTEGLNKQ